MEGVKANQNETAQVGDGQSNCLPRLTYKLKEAAIILGVSKMTIRREIDAGHIKTLKRMRHVLIPSSELTAWAGRAR